MSCSTCENTTKLAESTPKETWRTLKSLLRASAHPSRSPDHQIPQLLTQVERDVEHCEAEMNRLQRLMYQLEIKKKSLAGQAEAYRSLLSPIRKLPAEVLREIFSFACIVNSVTTTPEGWEANIPALRIACVCSFWRAEALSSPVLWSQIHIHRRGSLPLLDLAPETAHLLRMLAQRSGNSLLHLSYEERNSNAEGSPQFVELRCLAEVPARWGSLTVMMTQPTLDISALGDMRDRLSGLVSLACSVRHSARFSKQRLGPFPKLHHLELIVSPPSWIEIPWKQLQVLHLTLFHVSATLQHLKDCLALRRLHIAALFDLGNAGIAAQTVVCGAVQFFLSFSRLVGENVGVQALLEGLVMPALSDLHVDCTEVKSDAVNWQRLLPAFEGFLTRSASPLSSLVFQDVQMSPDVWLSILSLMPTLTHLTVVETSGHMNRQPTDSLISKAFIDALQSPLPLSINASESDFLPQLKYLKMDVRKGSFSDEGLVEMVKSRSLAITNDDVASLRSIHLFVRQREVNLDCVSQLRGLLGHGVYISVMDKTGWVL